MHDFVCVEDSILVAVVLQVHLHEFLQSGYQLLLTDWLHLHLHCRWGEGLVASSPIEVMQVTRVIVL